MVVSRPWVTPSSLRPLRTLTANVSLSGKKQLSRVTCEFLVSDVLNSVVHAKAAGAWGEFEVTQDNSWLTSAKFLNGVGKKTKVLFRLSTTGGEKGSSDLVRDVRGFSVKFYTEEGNHDIVGNHLVSFYAMSLDLGYDPYSNLSSAGFLRP